MENGAFVFERTPQREAVREVAVMAQRHVAVMEAEHEGLNVVDAARAGRRIAHMADCGIALKSLNVFFVLEHLREQSEPAVPYQVAVVVGDYAGTLLTTMLQCV